MQTKNSPTVNLKNFTALSSCQVYNTNLFSTSSYESEAPSGKTMVTVLENDNHAMHPHLMLDSPSNLMWHMVDHFVLSKVLRYHLVLSQKSEIQNEMVFYMSKEQPYKSMWT